MSLACFSRNLSPEFSPVITIGNFDGFHTGHRKLWKEAQKMAAAFETEWGILTFSPHPSSVITGTKVPMLMSNHSKIAAAKAMGASFIVIQHFDDQFAQTTSSEFLDFLLPNKGRICGLVVGYDFHFGKGRQGQTDDLMDKLNRNNISFMKVAPVSEAAVPVSSTRIRNLLIDTGDMTSISRLLGRPYSVYGKVIHGNKVGRTIGFPTANIDNTEEALPRSGVYSGFVASNYVDPISFPEDLLPMIANIGTAPTITPEQKQKLEVHILSSNIPNDSLYEKDLRIYFCHRLRSEIKFESLNQLTSQISSDKKTALSELHPPSDYWKHW